jgi:hypothetical protein
MGISDAVGVWGESNTWHGLAGLSKSTTGGHGVYGKNLSGGTGVVGESDGWMGVYGHSKSTTGGAGVMGEGDPAPGVIGKSTKWIGVYGETAGIDNGPAGVWGEHKGAGIGVKAVSKDGTGLAAYSTSYEAVHAETHSQGTAAIAGYNLNVQSTGAAIYGEHKGNSIGVLGKSAGGVGVWGVSQGHEGMHAETHSQQTAAIAAFNLNPNGVGAAIFARKEGGAGHAGFFDGRVWITGELGVGGDIVLPNADVAEDFDVSEGTPVEPGSVVVIGEDGALHECTDDYDGRVAGVVSCAGAHRPAMVLDRRRVQQSRQPVALMGKVFCKVDADLGAIAAGDLLTTSSTRGHAMKATDRQRAFGAAIGKALGSLDAGRGLIPVLVGLR